MGFLKRLFAFLFAFPSAETHPSDRGAEDLNKQLDSSDPEVRAAAAARLRQAAEREARRAEWNRLMEAKIAPVRHMSEAEMVGLLRRLCAAYDSDNGAAIAELEPLATAVGERLNHEGGMDEMRRVFGRLGPVRGARTLEMHWGGIGDWQG